MTEEKIVALGFFDGVHSGHQKLLKTAVEIGKSASLPVYALTFRGLEFFKKVDLISTYNDRCNLIMKQSGITDIIPIEFDSILKDLSGEEFVDLLCQKYHVRHIVTGENFTFGQDKADVRALMKIASDKNIFVSVVPLSVIDGQVISSSRIRDELVNGRIEAANRLLGHHHILSGEVIHGRHVGHTLGFPTLNVLYPENLIHLEHGVYITQTYLSNGRQFPSITNLGVHPTFESAGVPLTETYLYGEVNDLYGENVQIEFLSFLRKEQKFASVTDLCKQLKRDRESGIQYHYKRIEQYER